MASSIVSQRGCAHAVRSGVSFASSWQDIASGFCPEPALEGSDYCWQHDPQHAVDGLNTLQERAVAAHTGPIVVDLRGYTLATPKHLGWLLRHYTEVDHVYVAAQDDGQVRLVARMAGLQPGAVYVTTFASASVLWQWLSRPSFKGVRLDWMGTPTRCGSAAMPVVGPRPRRAQRAPMAGGPLNQAEYQAWLATSTPVRLVEDHYYVVGGTYAEQPACAICRHFRSEHHPSPVAGA